MVNLKIKETTHIDDKTGKTIIRLTPVLSTCCVASGELEFACFEVWQDEKHPAQAIAAQKALANAIEVIQQMANELKH